MKLRLPSLERRYVYVLNVKPKGSLIPFLWVAKVGFSVDADLRAADVERSIFEKTGHSVNLVVFFKFRVFLFRSIEKAVHNVLRWKIYRYTEFEAANGGTEFFRVFNLLTAAIISILYWGAGGTCPVYLFLFCLAIPYPIDFAILVAVLCGFIYLLIGCVIYAGYLITITMIGI